MKMMGGLGNQLFIYAAGRAIASHLDTELTLDLSSYLDGSTMGFELSWLTTDADAEKMASTPVHIREGHAGSRAGTLMNRRLRGRFSRKFFRETQYRFAPEVFEQRQGTTFEGYFQSWRYFKNLEGNLRKEFSQIEGQTEWFRRTEAQLSTLGNWFGLHVRRGDYLSPAAQAFHGLVGTTYYRRAVHLCEQLVGKAPLVVFSDDVSLAREVLREISDGVTFIEPPSNSPPKESLLLMMKARALVMANSSYSWWAAWLGEAPRRPVIAPRPWFRSVEVRESDLLLPEWISLGVD